MHASPRGNLLLISLLAMSSAACRPPAPDAPAADSPPARPAEAPGDLREIINRGLESGQKTIIVPPGRYTVAPRNAEHLRFEGLENVTIVMDGVEMICTETTRAITIHDCRNLTLRGLTIDYDPLPYTQGEIVDIPEGARQFTVEIIDGYKEPAKLGGSIEIFNPETGQLRARITHYGSQVAMEGAKRAVITKARSTEDFAFERLGDIAVISVEDAPGGFQPHAIMSTDSEGLVFEDITLHSGPTFGFFENGCDGSRYRRCRVERRGPESDPVVRARPRFRSMNADAFHSKNARRGPAYEECVAHHMGDDAIAINGDFHFVTEVQGDTLRVLAKGQMRMRAGDTVQFLTLDGKRPDDRRIVSIEPDGPVTAEESEDLRDRRLNPNTKRDGLSDAYRVVLDAAAEGVGRATVVCAADAIGSGFSIRGCRLGWNRSRGILVKAGRGEIIGNEITGSVMSAILLSPEYWWLEAGLSDNVIIADNVITQGRGMGIAVVSMGGDGTLSPAGAFRNITVRNNTIRGGAQPALLLTSVRGLVEENNTAEPDPSVTLNPWELKTWADGGLRPVIKLNNQPGGGAP